MYDADALEAINVEQLATATDRLLLRGGQLSKRRHIRRFAEGSQPHIRVTRFAEGSQSRIPVAQFTDGSQPRWEPDAGLAWESTVPQPLSPGRVPQPYVGNIVAAPFASPRHPKPPERYSQLAYDATAPFAPGNDPLELPSIVSVVHPAPPLRASQARYLAAPSVPGRAFLPRVSPSYAAIEPARFNLRSRRSQHAPTAVINRAAAPEIFASTVVIPALLGIAIGLAAQL